MNKSSWQQILLDVLFIVVGAFIYAAGIDMLIAPNQLTSGGLTGLATQLNFLTGAPIGVAVFLMNLPLLVLGWVKLGGRFVLSSAFATVISAVFIDTGKLWMPVYEGNQLLAALFGGALSGFGLSLLYLRGGSMGGSDIVCTLVNKRFSHFPIGKVSLAINAVVILCSAFVYWNVESALCSAVGAFVSSKLVDAILVGAESGNMLLMVTNKPQVLAAEIHKLVGRGATLLPAHGSYAGEERCVLICVARRHEFTKIKRVIKSIDPTAFVVVSDAKEIIGNGFKGLQ